MGTKIEWTDESWNPVVGCSKVSAGCDNCYAEKMAYRLACMGVPFYDMVQSEGRWNGNIELNKFILDKPLHWKKPRMIFVCSMGDLFHPSVPFEFIDKVIYQIYCNLQHTFQVLTKRPERMLVYFTGEAWLLRLLKLFPNYTPEKRLSRYFPLSNLWLGVTCENQETADKRIPILLQIPAAVRFVSFEPMLGIIDLRHIKANNGKYIIDVSRGLNKIDWVIVGCESGPKVRECKIEWVRSIVKQCRAADVPVFVKQLSINVKVSKNPEEWPEDLRIREYPIGLPPSVAKLPAFVALRRSRHCGGRVARRLRTDKKAVNEDGITR